MRYLSERARTLSASVYRVGQPREGITPVPLNVGDTYLPPPLFDLDFSEPHRYTAPGGLMSLRRALARRISERYCEVSTEQILVTPGGTAGLTAVVNAVVDAGDSVLLAAPYWPLISGITRIALARPVEVPIFAQELGVDELQSMLNHAHDKRTRALYVNPIHNPTGRLLSRAHAEIIVEFARRHDLWILADDVYEDFVYVDDDLPSLLAMAPERTVHIGSASKAFGIAGARLGWLAGPRELIGAAAKMHLNAGYCAPRLSQQMCEQALDVGGPGPRWQKRARSDYRKIGRAVAERLGVEAPKGGQFLFVDVSDALDHGADEPLTDFLHACLADGLAIAPGLSCGDFPEHVRICFTSAPPDDVLRGASILAKHLKRE